MKSRFVDDVFKKKLFGFLETTWGSSVRLFGNAEFLKCTQCALDCLRNTAHAQTVASNLSEIRQGLRSTGYICQRGGPVYIVGEFTWKLTPTGYASLIAHHAFRRKCYKTISGLADVKVEVECLIYQLDVLEELGVSDAEACDAIGLAKSEASSVFTQKKIDKINSGKTATKAKWQRLITPLIPAYFRHLRTSHLGIKIQGSSGFVVRCKESLDLLNGLPEWELISNNIALIGEKVTRTVFIRMSADRGRVFANWAIWQDSSAKSFAGIIAHEAFHNHLFRLTLQQGTAYPFDDPTGRQTERACTDFQIQVLTKLGDCELEIGTLQNTSHYPTHVGSKTNSFDLIWRRRRK
jgi:hypothetical protein